MTTSSTYLTRGGRHAVPVHAELSDNAAQWATWTRGVHRRPRARRVAARRDVALKLLLTLCLLMAVVLLAAGLRVPAHDVRHTMALVMSGALFALFAFTLADPR